MQWSTLSQISTTQNEDQEFQKSIFLRKFSKNFLWCLNTGKNKVRGKNYIVSQMKYIKPDC